MVACPFNIPTYEYDEPVTPRVMKCTMCLPRIKEGKLPGCVEICPKEALIFGKRDELIRHARQRIEKYPDRYIDHIYGEHEMGGTSWLYISSVPFGETGMNENLGTVSAPKLTSGALSAVPMVVGLWPVLLTGIYAVSKRKDKIAEEEKDQALSNLQKQADQKLSQELVKQRDKLSKEKENEVKKAVKTALDEAEKKIAKQEVAKSSDAEDK